MKYEGELYGKIGNKYIKLTQHSNDIDKLEKENKSLKKQFEKHYCECKDSTGTISIEICNCCGRPLKKEKIILFPVEEKHKLLHENEVLNEALLIACDMEPAVAGGLYAKSEKELMRS